jgi:hypothetical protein
MEFMFYVIGLAVASIVGMFGFVFASGQKENHDKKRQVTENLYQPRPGQPTGPLPPAQPKPTKKVPAPLAIFGVIGSLVVSIFSLLFFFGRGKQSRRNQRPVRRVLPNQRPPRPQYPYQQQIRQFPQQVQRRIPPQMQPKKKKGWWPF